MCVCMCALSVDLTLRTTGGGPQWAHIAEACGYVTSTWGSATSSWNSTGSKCTEPPLPLPTLTTPTPYSSTQHASARQNKLHRLYPHPTSPHPKQQARITLRPDGGVSQQWLFCCSGGAGSPNIWLDTWTHLPSCHFELLEPSIYWLVELLVQVNSKELLLSSNVCLQQEP